ncbi:hypothetical protein ACR3AM_005933 [Bacillus thuringiensis]
MQKTIKFLFVLSLIISSSFFVTKKADAAWSDWNNVPNAAKDCKVRVYTDATNYSSTAKTVDAKAETNGKCGTLYYFMALSWNGLDSASHDTTTGSFSSNTPVKQLKIGTVYDDETTYVSLVLFSDADRTKEIGRLASNTIYLKKNI